MTSRPAKPSIRGLRHIRPCRRCEAPIFFATTAAKGRPIPLDAKAQRLIRVEVADPIPGSLDPQLIAHVEEVYVPHHSTCPHADEFRRGKERPDATKS